MTLTQAVSVCFLIVSAFSHANVVWDKESNEFRTSLTLENNNNINHTSSGEPASEQLSSIGFNYRTLTLFEGFGVSLPVQFQRVLAANEAVNHHTNYRIAPEIKFFLAENLDARLAVTQSQARLFAGQTANELNAEATELNTQALELGVSFGRDQDEQQLSVTMSSQNNERRLLISNNELAIKKNTLHGVFAQKVSEDTHILFDASYSQEQRLENNVNNTELGLGFRSAFSGLHTLSAVAGMYQRRGDASSDGWYLRLDDAWQINERLRFTLGAHRHSQVSYRSETLTQVQSLVNASWVFAINDSHQVRLASQLTLIDFEQTSQSVKGHSTSLSWLWQWRNYLMANLSVTSQGQDTLSDEQVDATLARLSLEYVW